MSDADWRVIRRRTEESIAVKRVFLEAVAGKLAAAASAAREAVRAGGKVLLFGNGGSAADAQHIAAELVVRLDRDRRAIPAIALTTDTSALTAAGNDLGFDRIFARQIEALGRAGDIAVALTTSGGSANVVAGLEAAADREMLTIGFLGRDGGKCRDLCRHPLVVPSTSTQRIQEVHILMGHLLAELVEQVYFEEGFGDGGVVEGRDR